MSNFVGLGPALASHFEKARGELYKNEILIETSDPSFAKKAEL